MDRHPTPDTLKLFLLGRPSVEETKQVVAHLLAECAYCRDVVAPLAATFLWPISVGNPSDTSEDQYTAVVDSAIATVLERQRLLEHERLEAGLKVIRLLKMNAHGERLPQDSEFWTWGLCEVLQERSRALRQADPSGMLRLAALAVEAAQRLDPKKYGAPHVSDQLAQAWAELANSYRIADKLSLSETAFAQAFKAQQTGTGFPLLHARLAELSASLLCDQRQFPSAFRLLDFALGLYLKEQARHDAGRTLVKKGLHTGYTGDPEEGIRLLARALRLIDRNRDPKLVFQILHNILLFRVELGEFRPARIQLWEMRPLYNHHADHIAMVKLRGIEGRIYVGLRDFDRAERAFLQVKEGFEREKMIYDAALISFDLAAVWLQEGKRKEVRQLIQEMLETFRTRYVAREAIASLLMLRDAADRGSLSLDLLDMVAAFFRNLKEDSKAQDPGELH